MKYDRGFTFIELVVAIGVGAIALTVAIPHFSDFVKSNRLTTQTNLLVTALNVARGEAVNRGVNVNVTADGSWSDGWTVSDDGATFSRRFSPDGGSVTITSAGGNVQLTFLPGGRLNIAAGDTFTICDNRTGETGRQLTVSGTGRVSVTQITCS